LLCLFFFNVFDQVNSNASEESFVGNNVASPAAESLIQESQDNQLPFDAAQQSTNTSDDRNVFSAITSSFELYP
jgi:hypothetical protein